ncbi:MAG: hypothetical protein WAN63_04480 [Candidatus Sulfotelmatobacter sp.]
MEREHPTRSARECRKTGKLQEPAVCVVIPTGAGALATAEWRYLLFADAITGLS